MLNPAGRRKYPTTPPITIPKGAARRKSIRPSRETSFRICFLVMPMVRS